MPRVLALALIVAFSCLAPLDAQSTLYILTRQTEGSLCSPNGCQAGELFVIDPEARRVIARESTIHTKFSSGAYVTSDGRYLVWAGAEGTPETFAIAAYDASTGATIQATSLASVSGHLLGNPNQPEVFLSSANGPISVSPNGIRVLPTSCAGFMVTAISADGRRLAKQCSTGTPLVQSVEIVDVAGAVVNVIPGFASTLALSRDGTELYTIRRENLEAEIRRFDVATGALLSMRPTGSLDAFVHVDPRTGRLFLDKGSSGVGVLDPITLDQVGTLVLPPTFHHLAFDPVAPRAYAISTTTLIPGRSYRIRLDVIDTDTLAVIDGAELPYDNLTNAIVVAPRPAAPTVTATANGARVTLSWTAGVSRATTTHYVVEAGSAPGAANFGRAGVGLQTSVVVEGVPSGRYYVRVRAANYSGSNASAEIAIDVP